MDGGDKKDLAKKMAAEKSKQAGGRKPLAASGPK